ncbi:MAG: hypothetical protein GY943_19380, partial [Chloroflexi bacterium]|nr:hypothetical protein [Chloroflexota bacterium]
MKKSFIFTLCFLFLIVACQKTLAPTTQESTEPESTETNDTAVSEPTPFTEGEPESGVEATAVSVPTDTQPTLTPPPPPENTAPNVDTVDEPSAIQPNSETVTIKAADGLAMQATYAYPGGLPPYPGVMLLHMLGS